jgi:hypothetical protein
MELALVMSLAWIRAKRYSSDVSDVEKLVRVCASWRIDYNSTMPEVGKLLVLPGDINYSKGNFSFHFPVVTCIILSILLSLFWRLLRK